MDGYVELTLEKLKTHDGMAELNRMLKTLHDFIPGDGDLRRVINGVGSPEGVISAGIGSIYMRTDGGAGTSIYIKESGTGATGWVSK